MVQLYQYKKPYKVLAIQYIYVNKCDIEHFVNKRLAEYKDSNGCNSYLMLPTKECAIHIHEGDYVIKLDDNHFEVMDAIEFESLYKKL